MLSGTIDTLTADIVEILSSAVVGTATVDLGIPPMEKENNSAQCTTELLLPQEADTWQIAGLSLQGKIYQAPKEQSLSDIATFLRQVGKAVDMNIETSLSQTADVRTLDIKGDLYGLEKIAFVDGYGTSHSFGFAVDCHQ